ncbi:uncharacterized protein LOC113350389 isoform X2 [Papaver somniferum]|uniref:uncharacterized protein LOC113350389 isoform X2 n=1 Tax=Papaver somniferum TaxID=3469 RepID=UPI000E7021AF|nr:uncharacterized protein LOC113350389 isoform X2 [Papaver somniferum]
MAAAATDEYYLASNNNTSYSSNEPAAAAEQENYQGFGDSSYNDYTVYAPLYKAIFNNDWERAKAYLKHNPNAVSARLTSTGDTALHIAAVSGRIHLVKELVQLMPSEALEITTHVGCTALLQTAVTGSMEIAKLMVEKNSNLLRIKNPFNLIPLVVSAVNGNEVLLRYLYSVTPKEELDPRAGITGAAFLTSLIMADIYDIALDVLQRYPKLATSRDPDGNTIINMLSIKPSAFPSGNRHGLWQQLIYTSIPIELDHLFRDVERDEDTMRIRSEHVVQKFSQVRKHGLVWKALKVLVPGVRQIYEKKVIHVQALEIVKAICPQLSNLTDPQLIEVGAVCAITNTAAFGIIEYFKELINSSPYLMSSSNMNGSGLIQLAVMHRQEKIYNFMSQMGQKNEMAACIDNFGNNILHFAGVLAPAFQLDKVSGAALQMQREIQWFQEVEQMAQPKYRELPNKAGKKPRDIFREEHKALVKEGEAWLKETSQACMVVSTLIATVMFAAVFTVPGGNNGDTGTPIFLKTRTFYVFMICDAISLFASCTSILMFFAILTARYGEKDFLKSLPQKLILGLASLFISIATMMGAFGATLIIVLNGTVTWAYIPVTFLASVPVLLFGMLQFPLFVDIMRSTYGNGIFHKQNSKKKEKYGKHI